MGVPNYKIHVSDDAVHMSTVYDGIPSFVKWYPNEKWKPMLNLPRIIKIMLFAHHIKFGLL